jgi:predicted Zn-dependent peptidase
MAGLGLDWRLTVLPNGLRLVTVTRSGTLTVAVRAYVRAGSRYDGEHDLSNACGPPLGLAHLAEHLLFQGTRNRSQREIFASVERLGGALDGGTTKEYVTLCTVMPQQGLRVALDVLAALLIQPALREEDFWNEKLVILEEIRRAQHHQSVIYDLFAETLWHEHPFQHPVHGTLEALRDIEHEVLLSFYRERYVAGNMVLAVCGDIRHDEVRGLVIERFDGLRAGRERPPVPVRERPPSGPRTAHLNKEIGQTHVLIGVPTVGMKHEDRGPLKVIERVLGMGGSARLYQRLREEMRLVYSVRTVTANYEDAGTFAVYTACEPKNVVQVHEAVVDEWERLCQRGVSELELSTAKSNYAGTLARRFETNRALAGIFGVEALLHRVEPFEEALGRIYAVRPEDVMRVARKYLDPGRSVSASVGLN